MYIYIYILKAYIFIDFEGGAQYTAQANLDLL